MEGPRGPAFALTAEQERLAAGVRELARDVLEPLARAGPPGRVNRELVAALGAHGLLPRLFPRSAGGSAERAASAFELCLLREALARESTGAETALALQGLGADPILAAGPEPLVRRFLPEVAAGRAVAAFALSEAGAGSDAGGLELVAERDGHGFRLSGAKQWISNAPEADVYTVFARTTPGAKTRGITAFAVPGDAPGLGGEPIELLAPHPIGRLELDGVPVGPDQVLGAVDGGFAVAMRTLDRFRPSVGAFAVGMAQAALDLAVAHATTRRAFGAPLKDFQAVSHRLAELATRTEAARLLVYAAASRYDRWNARAADGRADGGGVTRASAMAKLYATETAQVVVDAAVQVHGAAALVRGHPLEHLYRDVRATRIYEGTSEIQRSVIARELFQPATTKGAGP
jgi:alkylation response protein AidB-like acyl-CoA dehydrogenase